MQQIQATSMGPAGTQPPGTLPRLPHQAAPHKSDSAARAPPPRHVSPSVSPSLPRKAPPHSQLLLCQQSPPLIFLHDPLLCRQGIRMMFCQNEPPIHPTFHQPCQSGPKQQLPPTCSAHSSSGILRCNRTMSPLCPNIPVVSPQA